MNGSTWTIPLVVGQEYGLPAGFGSDGYSYRQARFVGRLVERHSSCGQTGQPDVLVFQEDDRWTLAHPTLSVRGHKLEITLQPFGWGETFAAALKHYGTRRFEWESFVADVDETKLPVLGEHEYL